MYSVMSLKITEKKRRTIDCSSVRFMKLALSAAPTAVGTDGMSAIKAMIPRKPARMIFPIKPVRNRVSTIQIAATVIIAFHLTVFRFHSKRNQ